jgi:hypothetical protein
MRLISLGFTRLELFNIQNKTDAERRAVHALQIDLATRQAQGGPAGGRSFIEIAVVMEDLLLD